MRVVVEILKAAIEMKSVPLDFPRQLIKRRLMPGLGELAKRIPKHLTNILRPLSGGLS